jgi:DNA-binding transcriptional ArsR family regulator
VDIFDAIADPTRRRVIERLANEPLSAGALAAVEATSRPAVSRHLRVLREAGIVEAIPTGRHRIYRLVPGALDPVDTWLITTLAPPRAPITAAQLDGLDLEVRRTVRERAHERETTGSRVPREESA